MTSGQDDPRRPQSAPMPSSEIRRWQLPRLQTDQTGLKVDFVVITSGTKFGSAILCASGVSCTPKHIVNQSAKHWGKVACAEAHQFHSL